MKKEKLKKYYMLSTAGIYTGSFLIGKNTWISIGIPAVTASLMTTLMYIGELILLNGHLYRFGKGFLFRGLWAGIRDFNPGGVFNLGLAPIDFIIILASGLICAWILGVIRKKEKSGKGGIQQ